MLALTGIRYSGVTQRYKHVTRIDNPFDLTKASDYSNKQVLEFWVDRPADKSLVDLLKPKSRVPMFLLGGKGSGKTHLMRYCASAVQALRHEGLEAAVKAEGYLGVYTSADGLNVFRFSGKGFSEDLWEGVFAYSFELWLASVLLAALRPTALDQSSEDDARWSAFGCGVLGLAGLGGAPSSLNGLIKEIADLRGRIDRIVNNAGLARSLDGINITFNPGDLIFGIPALLCDMGMLPEGTLIIYLIDEVENFSERQQRFLNTLVRYRRGNVTFRIGARLYGIKTKETLGSGESIKRDAEYEQFELDEMLRENTEFDNLAVQLVLRRLAAAGAAGGLDEKSLAGCFEDLDSSEYYRNVAVELTAAKDAAGKPRPWMSSFVGAISAVADSGIAEELGARLAVPDHPLLEKLNLLAFSKRVGRDVDLSQLANEIAEERVQLWPGGGPGEGQYYDLYEHFSSDLLAQLYRENGRRPYYGGFKTILRISQGNPRNLLSLLKHIYGRSTFAGGSPFSGAGSISILSQTQGIQDAAEWFWEDSQPDSNGPLVRNTVDNIATLIRSIRYSDNPSECDLCCFLVDEDELPQEARTALMVAENWSFFVRVGKSSGAKNNNRVLKKYQLNPMLSARWGISDSRRGVIELRGDSAAALLCQGGKNRAQTVIHQRVSAMFWSEVFRSRISSNHDGRQQGLFNG